MIPELPDDLPSAERDVVRVVVQDARGDVLLFHAQDGAAPDTGIWWELPGGGLDAGETYAAAAVRELREEAGSGSTSAQIGPPLWRRTATFRYRDVRHLQHEVVALTRIDAVAPDIDVAERLDYERDDYSRLPLVAGRGDHGGIPWGRPLLPGSTRRVPAAAAGRR